MTDRRAAAPASQGRWIAAIGCERLDRLVRVGLPEKPPASPVAAAVPCPCGETHRRILMARPSRRGEVAEVELSRIDWLKKSRRRR